MTNKQTIIAFIGSINAHDVEGLGALMSDDHTFIDAHDNQISWQREDARRLARLPRVVSRLLHRSYRCVRGRDSFALLGFAGGSYQNQQSESWRLPAEWKAIVQNDLVTLWQVFADTKIPSEIIERNSR